MRLRTQALKWFFAFWNDICFQNSAKNSKENWKIHFKKHCFSSLALNTTLLTVQVTQAFWQMSSITQFRDYIFHVSYLTIQSTKEISICVPHKFIHLNIKKATIAIRLQLPEVAQGIFHWSVCWGICKKAF